VGAIRTIFYVHIYFVFIAFLKREDGDQHSLLFHFFNILLRINLFKYPNRLF